MINSHINDNDNNKYLRMLNSNWLELFFLKYWSKRTKRIFTVGYKLSGYISWSLFTLIDLPSKINFEMI